MTVLRPGFCDPRVRAFTKTQGGEPPTEDLDRIALLSALDFSFSFKAPPGAWDAVTWETLSLDRAWILGGAYQGPKGTQHAKDVALQMNDREGAQHLVLELWDQLVSLGPLPEDAELDARSGDPWFDWPDKGKNRTRLIYFWQFKKDSTVEKCMQVQKYDPDADDGAGGRGAWRIFNQWGEDLTYVYKPNERAWVAGFDLGEWFRENTTAIITAAQLAMSVLEVAITFGAAAPGVAAANLATLAAAQAAQKAAIEGMKSMAQEDAAGAAKAFGEAGAALAANAPIADALAKTGAQIENLVGRGTVSQFAKLVAEAKSFELDAILEKARAIGGSMPQISSFVLDQALAQLPPESVIWFRWGRDAAKAGDALDLLEHVPFYGRSPFSYGAALGALELAQEHSIVEAMDPEATMTWRQALARSQQAVTPQHDLAALSYRQVIALGGKSTAIQPPAKAAKKFAIGAALLTIAGYVVKRVVFG